jgi:carbon storage regulator
MLVLCRKLGEEIVIGDNIRLAVVAIHGNHVRLGITAPQDVSIRREELQSRANGNLGAKPEGSERPNNNCHDQLASCARPSVRPSRHAITHVESKH